MFESTRKIEYKCINCGETKNSAKQCGCPNCGYKMFPTPYDRSEVLIGEIRGFIQKLELTEIESGDLRFPGKSSDDERFPDFNRIQNYACSSEKTEEFFDRVNQSIEQIDAHIHKSFHKKYQVDYMPLKSKVEENEMILKLALADLGIEKEFDAITIPEIRKGIKRAKRADTEYDFDIEDTDFDWKDSKDSEERVTKTLWPEVTLIYEENPNSELLAGIEELLSLLRRLSDKIFKFIKANNVYGTVHKKKPKDIFKEKSDTIDYVEELSKSIGYVNKILGKKYEIDIFSDGTEEQTEMLTGLWSAIAMIMRSPFLVQSFVYEIKGEGRSDKAEFENKIISITQQRYEEINAKIFDMTFFEDKEDRLFALYNKMLSHDTLGIMGANAGLAAKVGKNEKKLNMLIGLASIKESILKIKAYALANKENDNLNIHMCFYGNPGTGKTEVARIIAGILYENKILPSNKVIEVDRSGLVGQYLGETPQKTMAKIQQAMGGVLFIDEAYSLVPVDDRGYDYGHEAVATLIKAMEDYRGKFCVILAGYRNQMQQMLVTNPGFKSRIQFELDFPNYTREELGRITDLMLVQRNYTMTDQAKNRMLDLTDVKRKDPNFANAREIRNILDQVIMCQNIRTLGLDDKELGVMDINKYIQDAKISIPTGNGDAEKKSLLVKMNWTR